MGLQCMMLWWCYGVGYKSLTGIMRRDQLYGVICLIKFLYKLPVQTHLLWQHILSRKKLETFKHTSLLFGSSATQKTGFMPLAPGPWRRRSTRSDPGSHDQELCWSGWHLKSRMLLVLSYALAQSRLPKPIAAWLTKLRGIILYVYFWNIVLVFSGLFDL
jgi:hypothetical protein